MGDAEVMVQKALSWAIREWTRVDAGRGRVRCSGPRRPSPCERRDGARAWVIRDSLSQPATRAGRRRCVLGSTGIRRDASAPSTSIAAGQAAGFAAALTSSNDAVAAQGDRYTRSRA